MKSITLSIIVAMTILHSAYSQQAQMTSPAPGSTITSTPIVFRWSNAYALEYFFYLGSAKGKNDYFGQSMGTATSVTISWPKPPSSFWVRVWSRGSSGWRFYDTSYTYSAQPFILPVTTDTGGYRKFDSAAVAGKFHTGDDYYNSNLNALATYSGYVVAIYTAGKGDHGFGNTLIVEHTTATGTVYSQYSHLDSFARDFLASSKVARGEIIGTIGKTGNSNGIVHLHFELKKSATLGNPTKFGSISADTQYGYVPQNAVTATATSATNYGYYKPSAVYGKFAP